ncbi:MAG: anaerobic ribonucleoside-triphosphate reductase activating protein [Lachnospiraceae bacterium]
MNIQGLQKLTLLDYPGKVSCTIFTGGCNLRCPFCHNASLVIGEDSDNQLTKQEVLTFLKKRQGILDGVCISGGEPLIQSDIVNVIEEIKELGYLVKLDTNGTFPGKLKELVQRKLVDYVAMDIKNSPAHYGKTVGIENYDTTAIEESVEFLMSGVIPYEFRTTVVRELHTREDFMNIGTWLKGAEQYFLQGFIDSGDLIQSNLHAYDKKIMEQIESILKPCIPHVCLRGID